MDIPEKMADCAASSAKVLYKASAPTTALCMSTFLEYVASYDSRSPDPIIAISWVASAMICITVGWLHWEAYQVRKYV